MFFFGNPFRRRLRRKRGYQLKEMLEQEKKMQAHEQGNCEQGDSKDNGGAKKEKAANNSGERAD